MKVISYKLNKDLVGRAASLFYWQLNKFNFNIYLETSDKRRVNGKSLIGILSGNFKKDQIITLFVSKNCNNQDIYKYLEEYGKIIEIKEG